jgi:hypothetical protein
VGREARSDALSVAAVGFDGKVKLGDILTQLEADDTGRCVVFFDLGRREHCRSDSGLLGKCLQGHNRAIGNTAIVLIVGADLEP